MTEQEYLIHLDMRISRELARVSGIALQAWWCDGFIPEKFVTANSGCHISGRVWMDSGTGQTRWNFVVLLGKARTARDEIDWAKHLLADDISRWLSLDFEFMKVKTFVGHQDDISTKP